MLTTSILAIQAANDDIGRCDAWSPEFRAECWAECHMMIVVFENKSEPSWEHTGHTGVDTCQSYKATRVILYSSALLESSDMIHVTILWMLCRLVTSISDVFTTVWGESEFTRMTFGVEVPELSVRLCMLWIAPCLAQRKRKDGQWSRRRALCRSTKTETEPHGFVGCLKTPWCNDQSPTENRGEQKEHTLHCILSPYAKR